MQQITGPSPEIIYCETMSDVMIEYWSDPKNCEAQSERKIAQWADPNIPFNPNAFQPS